jgi:hypothetical protein
MGCVLYIAQIGRGRGMGQKLSTGTWWKKLWGCSGLLECDPALLYKWFLTFQSKVMPSFWRVQGQLVMPKSVKSLALFMDLKPLKMNVTCSFKTPSATCPATQFHVPQDQNPQYTAVKTWEVTSFGRLWGRREVGGTDPRLYTLMGLGVSG